MALYALFSALASVGLIDFDHATGDVAFNIYNWELVATGIVGYVATFVTSRVAKARGGAT
jgi:hypothetical protein